jgi:hypothetical protein
MSAAPPIASKFCAPQRKTRSPVRLSPQELALMNRLAPLAPQRRVQARGRVCAPPFRDATRYHELMGEHGGPPGGILDFPDHFSPRAEIEPQGAAGVCAQGAGRKAAGRKAPPFPFRKTANELRRQKSAHNCPTNPQARSAPIAVVSTHGSRARLCCWPRCLLRIGLKIRNN